MTKRSLECSYTSRPCHDPANVLACRDGENGCYLMRQKWIGAQGSGQVSMTQSQAYALGITTTPGSSLEEASK